ncbi:MAG: helix-turn-helix domain-containing protein [Sulfuricellaceae bacterium]|nr:helix-turn-helix domain-containing protein [Sulfuricellaceae bacterium]
MAISRDERGFFVVLGNRIARLRKDRHLTQAQLAETLGISQPTMNAYELGQRRVPVSALPVLARALGAGLEDMLGETNTATRKRGPAPKWQQQIEAIAQLPKAQQRFVSQMLDTVLTQAQR